MRGPSVSRHLKVLRESGVISFRQSATSRIYRLEPQSLDEARQWMQAQLDVLHARFDRLAAHLDAMQERGDSTWPVSDLARASVDRYTVRVRPHLSAPDRAGVAGDQLTQAEISAWFSTPRKIDARLGGAFHFGGRG